MDQIELILELVKNKLWGAPLLVLIMGTGVYLTIILRGLQFKYLWYGTKQVFAKQQADSKGDISHFEALMTSLAGAIGTGTIVGVATAVAVGGLGSLFWMWITAFFGMATKYAESMLAVKYRSVDSRGEMSGGPMQYIAKGLGWKTVALLFALFGSIAAIGTGNLVQVNSIADALENVWSINPWVSGAAIAILTGLVLIGGVKSIGHLAGVLVPFMAIFYIIGGVVIIFLKWNLVPEAIQLIFTSAFEGQAAAGGFAGATVMMAIQMGVARSVISNEAGLGISSIAAAAAITDQPARQGLINMTGIVATMIVCTFTGLVLAVTQVVGKTDSDGYTLNGASLAIEAFSSTLPWGEYIVTIGLVLFAWTTVVAWAYYGEKCFEYLLGEKAIIPYRILYTLLVIPGAAINLELAWHVADISNALMVIPNLIALIALTKVIKAETKSFIETINLKPEEA